METLDRTMNMKIIVHILWQFPSGNVRKPAGVLKTLIE